MSSVVEGASQQGDARAMWQGAQFDDDVWDFDNHLDGTSIDDLSDVDWPGAGPANLTSNDPASSSNNNTTTDSQSLWTSGALPDSDVRSVILPQTHVPTSSSSTNPHDPSHSQSHHPRSGQGESTTYSHGGRFPRGDYREDWLDDQIAAAPNQDWDTLLNDEDNLPWRFSPSAANTTANATPIDFLSDNDMPSTTRRRTQPRPVARNSVVDLTADASSSSPRGAEQNRRASRPKPRSLKRAAQDEAEAQQARPSKHRRRRLSSASVERLDLTNEAPSIEEELLQQHKAQEKESDPTGPLKLAARQCIICMEPYTNATVTACGHIYCHECLSQALRVGEKNSERGVGSCPVCRKPVNRKRAGNMVVVNFMRKSAFHVKGRRIESG